MRMRCFALGFFSLTVYALFFTFAEGWNGQSRWALSLAIARRGTTAVDEFIGESRDVCVSRGRLYAAKAPGMGLLGAPLVWCADRIVPVATPASDAAKRFLVRMMLVSVPAAALGVMLCMSGMPSASLAAVACCLGSPVLPYATLFYGHVPAGLCLLVAWRYARSKAFGRAGLMAGIGIAVDYLTGVGVAVLLVVVARRGVLRMLIGMLPAVIALGIYNLVSFGTVFATGYERLADEGFAAAMSHGFLGVGLPSFAVLLAMLFGTYRGLFLLSPWLILWVVAAVQMRRSRQDLVMTVGVPGLYLLLFSGFPAWWGGASCTVRHAIPVIPLMAWAVATLRGRWRGVLLFLGLLGSAVQLGFTLTEPEMPEDVAFPLVDFVVPHVAAGRLRATLFGAQWPGQWAAVAVACAACIAAWVTAWRAGGCWLERRVVSWVQWTIDHGNPQRRNP